MPQLIQYTNYPKQKNVREPSRNERKLLRKAQKEMSIDPLLLARMANAPAPSQPSPQEMFLRQQELAIKQASVTLDAAKFIVAHANIYKKEDVEQAHSFVSRALKALDNIRLQEPNPENPKERTNEEAG